MSTYYEKVPDCPITLNTATVLYPYIDNEKSRWFKEYGGYCTGWVIECSEVYAICNCVCTYVGQDIKKNRYVAIIQFNSDISFRYCNLKELYVNSGDILDVKTPIGIADKTCRFEYLSSAQGSSKWCVRVGQKQYYTQDPIDYASGKITLYTSGLVNPNDPDVDLEGIIDESEFPQSTFDLYGDGY